MSTKAIIRPLAIVTIAVFAVAGLFTALPALAQEVTPVPPVVNQSQFPANTVTVAGIGVASGAPDIAYIELGVEMVEPELADAYSQAAGAIQAVIDALVDLGIAEEDIRTSSVNIYPQEQFNPQTGEPGERTYRVSNILRITVRDVSMIESVISTAVDAGANTIYNFNFGIDNSVELEQQARLDAVANARERAEQLASAVGASVGDAIVISESYGNYQPLQPYGRGGAASMDVAAMPIAPGQLDVTVQVLVTFTLER
ncbi:MAG: SIMPL domain-containing protein [Chloroflexota bacterium]